MSAVEAFSFEQLSGGKVEPSAASSAATRAAGIVDAALAEAEGIRAQAWEEGYAAGRLAGLAGASDEIEPVKAAFVAAAQEVRASLVELEAEAERQAVELALALADKIVATALELRPELVRDVAAGALRGVGERRLVLEVHPDDVVLMEGFAEGIEVVGERRVPRGGCVVRTPEGEIDARVAEQLQRAGEVIRSAL